MDGVKEKECKLCKEVKPLNRYFTDPHSDDMYMDVCRACCGVNEVERGFIRAPEEKDDV